MAREAELVCRKQEQAERVPSSPQTKSQSATGLPHAWLSWTLHRYTFQQETGVSVPLASLIQTASWAPPYSAAFSHMSPCEPLLSHPPLAVGLVKHCFSVLVKGARASNYYCLYKLHKHLLQFQTILCAKCKNVAFAVGTSICWFCYWF